MKLIEIDKTRYRKHLNIIIVGFIAIFTLLSLGYGQLLISLFSDGEGSNFRYNLMGVILGLLSSGLILSKLREHDFFYEVYYVWRLKQIMNLIYRKLKNIKAQAATNNVNALIILLYYYQASRQVYLLDDNTMTLSAITKTLDKIQAQITKLNLSISSDDFDRAMLDTF
jgi:hypothetical protein